MDICFSGGAAGADYYWGLAAKDYGHELIHYSFKGHHACVTENLVRLSDDELAGADAELEKIKHHINRHIPYGTPWVLNLLRRNWYQVKDSDRIYAVSEMDPYSLSRCKVNGGTAWAIEMAIENNIHSIYIFDQKSINWYEWKNRMWNEIIKPPKPHGYWTGIGKRKISDQGIIAICELFVEGEK